MTTYTGNLRIPHLDQNVAQPEVPENTAKEIIDAMLSGKYIFNVLANTDQVITHTDTPTASTDWQNLIIEITDTSPVLTAPIDIILPVNQRVYIFINSTLQDLTMKVAGQPGEILYSGTNMYAFCDGVDIVKYNFSANISVVDTLSSTSAINALSANQGKVLNDGKEAVLGDPLINGYVLSSLTDGTRLWVEAGGTGGEFIFIADGAITEGEPVSLQDDGTVKSCGLHSEPIQIGSGAIIGDDHVKDSDIIYDSTNSQFIYASEGWAVAITVTDLSQTVGTRVGANSGDATVVAHDPVKDLFVMLYRDIPLHAKIIDSAANRVLTLSTEKTISALTMTEPPSLIWDPVNVQFVAFYVANHTLYSRTLKINGTNDDFILGTETLYKTTNPSSMKPYVAAYNPDTDTFLLSGSYFNGSDYTAEYIPCSISGETITSGTPLTFTGISHTEKKLMYIGDNKYVVVYKSSAALYSRVLLDTSGVISSGTETTIQDAYDPYEMDLTIDSTEGQALVSYRKNDASEALMSNGTISGVEISFLESVIDNIGYYIGTSIGYSSELARVLYTFTTNNVGTSVVIKNAAIRSNTSSFIGLAKEAFADTNPGTVTILSGVNNKQSGLTTDAEYYINQAGDYTNTLSDNTYIGRAISATEIQVNHTSPLIEDLYETKENDLGKPSTDGQILISLANGTRSWANSGGSSITVPIDITNSITAGDFVCGNTDGTVSACGIYQQAINIDRVLGAADTLASGSIWNIIISGKSTNHGTLTAQVPYYLDATGSLTDTYDKDSAYLNVGNSISTSALNIKAIDYVNLEKEEYLGAPNIIGQVLSSDTLGNRSWATVASNSKAFIARGAISEGDAVSLNDDGTVTPSGLIGLPLSTGTSIGFVPGKDTYRCHPIQNVPGTNRVIIHYVDENYAVRAMLADIENESLTLHLAETWHSSVRLSFLGLCYDETNDKIICVGTNESAAHQATFAVGTITGDTISFGSVVTDITNVLYNSILYYPPTGKIIYAFQNSGSKSKVGTVSGDSITFGTIDTIPTFGSISVRPELLYDASANRVIMIARSLTGGYLRASVGEVIADNISWNTAIDIYAGEVDSFSAVFDTTNNNIIVSYIVASTGDVYTKIGSASATTTTWGTADLVESVLTVSDSRVSYDSAEDIFVCYYTSGSLLKIKIGLIAGTNSTFSEATSTLSSVGTMPEFNYVEYNPVAERFVYLFGGTNNTGMASVVTNTKNQSNSDLWIGISDNTVADTENVQVTISGRVNDSHTGLTVNEDYYISDTGAITVLPSRRFVGKAISETEIQISATNPLIEDLYETKENDLGKPSTDDQILTSTIDGTRSWVSKEIGINFVADGAITAGDLVTIQSDGTVILAASPNTPDLIGIAYESIADTQTGIINIISEINTSQSGLTTGLKYYCDINGALTTVSTSNVYVGRAVSATEILIGIQ